MKKKKDQNWILKSKFVGQQKLALETFFENRWLACKLAELMNLFTHLVAMSIEQWPNNFIHCFEVLKSDAH